MEDKKDISTPKQEDNSNKKIDNNDDSNKTLIIIGVIVGVVVLLCLCLCSCFIAISVMSEYESGSELIIEDREESSNSDDEQALDERDSQRDDEKAVKKDEPVQIDPLYDDATTDEAYEKLKQQKNSSLSAYSFTEVSIDDDPIIGDINEAAVVLVEFADYECPFCKRHFENTQPDLVSNHVETGELAIVFRDFPLSFHDPAATTEAIAAECVDNLAGDSAYFEMHDAIFENSPGNGEGLFDFELEGFAIDAGVDVDDFNNCFENEETFDEIQNDIDDGQEAGITGTPGFVLGYLQSDGTVKGVLISGAYPYSSFESVIDAFIEAL